MKLGRDLPKPKRGGFVPVLKAPEPSPGDQLELEGIASPIIFETSARVRLLVDDSHFVRASHLGTVVCPLFLYNPATGVYLTLVQFDNFGTVPVNTSHLTHASSK